MLTTLEWIIRPGEKVVGMESECKRLNVLKGMRKYGGWFRASYLMGPRLMDDRWVRSVASPPPSVSTSGEVRKDE